MNLTEHDVGDVTVLTIDGRIIFDEGEGRFRTSVDALIKRGRVKLVLDLGSVTYVDSAGLGLLISKYVGIQRHGGDLRLCRVTPRTAHLLEITKLSEVLRAFDSEEDAVRSFASA